MTADKLRNIANSSKHQAWTVYCHVLDGKWVHGTRTIKESSSFSDTVVEQREQVASPHADLGLEVTIPQLENC
eukprot:12751674-Heterocapsa_arctica.AAC.1